MPVRDGGINHTFSCPNFSLGSHKSPCLSPPPPPSEKIAPCRRGGFLFSLSLRPLSTAKCEPSFLSSRRSNYMVSLCLSTVFAGKRRRCTFLYGADRRHTCCTHRPCSNVIAASSTCLGGASCMGGGRAICIQDCPFPSFLPSHSPEPFPLQAANRGEREAAFFALRAPLGNFLFVSPPPMPPSFPPSSFLPLTY